ncbi:MAG: hypothetical protein V4615_04650 [Bacteroidota bacterium]
MTTKIRATILTGLFLFGFLPNLKAQEYVLDGIKNKFVFGMIEIHNGNYGVIYKNENKQVVLQQLDKDLKPLSTHVLNIDLKHDDQIGFSKSNGKTTVMEINKFRGHFSNASGMSSSYESYLVVLNSDYTFSEKAPYNPLGYNIHPDPSSTGYYLLDQLKITKLDNQMRKAWEYQIPKGYRFLVGGSNYLQGTNLFAIDSIGICLTYCKYKELTQKTKLDDRIIRLSSKTGQILFDKPIDNTQPKLHLKVIAKNGICYLNGFLGSVWCKDNPITGFYQLAINSDGKVLSEKSYSTAGHAPEFCDDRGRVLLYFRDVVIKPDGWIAIFEKAKANEFVVFNLTGSKTVEYKIINREKSDMGSALSTYLGVLSGGAISSKLLDADYVATLPLDLQVTSFGMVLEKVDKKAAEDVYEYQMLYASFSSDSVPDKKVLARYKDFDVFFRRSYDKLYSILDWEKGCFVIGYSMTYDNKFIIKKTIF